MKPESARKIDAEFTKYPMRSYPKGQIILFAGENPEHIFYLAKGKVRKYDVSYRGDEVAVNIFKPPSFFPMSWAINKTTNHYFYKAEEPTQVHIVPACDAEKFIKDNPDLLIDLVSVLYAAINGLQGRIVQLMSGTAKNRVIYELIVECHRFGETDSNGGYRMSTNESDIAARSGLSRETVNREMRKLKDKGLVSVNKRVIVVHDLQAIEKAFGNQVPVTSF